MCHHFFGYFYQPSIWICGLEARGWLLEQGVASVNLLRVPFGLVEARESKPTLKSKGFEPPNHQSKSPTKGCLILHDLSEKNRVGHSVEQELEPLLRADEAHQTRKLPLDPRPPPPPTRPNGAKETTSLNARSLQKVKGTSQVRCFFWLWGTDPVAGCCPM